MALTIGTAGHIDHGKTWLVRALTGKDTDRLPEEQRRGISIDLGYAPLELPDGRRASVVDVPGHERFVRAMVAGATGIDLFLLVVDAGEGARPQTHEHLAILRLLGIERGVVAVTKADAVDADVLELAVEEAHELVPGAEVVAVSAKTGLGIEELRAAIGRAADGVGAARADRPTRLWVDRSFSLRGVGTVVTGTLWSGSIGAGDELRIEPSGAPVRVRSVQVHDRDVARADAGQRVAVSLPGVERREVVRGEALVAQGAYPVSFRLDVALDELEPIADGARLHVHIGTASEPARVVRIGDRWAQLRLASPVVAARGDRVVLRGETTVGGGTVLDPAPPRHREEERMALVERGEIAATVHAPVLVSALDHLADGELAGLEHAGTWVFSADWLAELERDLRQRISEADPIDPGVAPPPDAWAADIVPRLGLERRGAKLYLPGSAPSLGRREEAATALEQELADAGVRATKVDDAELVRFLAAKGTLVTLGDGYAIGAAAYETARDVALGECRANGEITLARFRDLVGTGRRDAQLLLERFDRDGLTRRVGDARVLRRGADQALNTPTA
jgi:selenocysteine-specific elongation factor